MSVIPIEVPIQPYAGELLIIKDLILPDVAKIEMNKSNKKKTRISFFDRNSILKKILKHFAQNNKADDICMVDCESLLDAFLSALETYMKFVLKKTIELCEHRCGYHLYKDERCVMKNDMRTTMMFLNDLEMADYGSSDDDAAFYRKRRAETVEKEKKSVRVESVNDTAMLAIGGRKRGAEDPVTEPTPVAISAPANVPVQKPFGLRFKHLNIRDVMQFMEEDRRYWRSNMLFEAYLKYKY
uniref:Transcription initiation factor TFIID subunit 4 n=1 Tax=Drosophila rhopaloa TaxID=1041015 RepID=A0A6P4E602_DRORH